MRYEEPRERSAELLRLALPLMAQQQAGFHPVSFTLWYEHVAGINPELSQILAPHADGQQPLTDNEAYNLYARHRLQPPATRAWMCDNAVIMKPIGVRGSQTRH